MQTKLIAVLAAGVIGVAAPGMAGISVSPEVADPAGDANVASSFNPVPEPDSRPLSIDSADLRAAWFETTFTVNKTRDSETGQVVRVEHIPTGVQVHIRTEASVRPTWQNRIMLYRIIASRDVPGPGFGGWHYYMLRANPAPGTDTATLYSCGSPTYCPAPGSVSYQGTVATMSFSYSDPQIMELLPVGTVISLPRASSYAHSGLPVHDMGGLHVQIDSTRQEGSPFTVGADVPPDVDCAVDPGYPECQD